MMIRAIILIGVAVVLCFPLLMHGPLPNADDSVQHINWYLAFAEEVGNGTLYPRWLPSLNGGLGSPVFFVYGPLPYYVPLLLKPVARLWSSHRPLLDFDLALVLALAVSGFAAYAWLRRSAPAAAALLGAVAYMALPSHLYLTLYMGCSISSLWAYAAMPLALLGVEDTVDQRRWGPALLAIGYSMVVFSNLFSALLFSPVLAVYALWRVKRAGSLAAAVALVGAAALGLGLSAVYLVPALDNEKFVPARVLTQEEHYNYEKNFLVVDGRLLKGGERRSSWYATWSVIALWSVLLPAAFCARKEDRRETLVWLGLGAAATFMMLPASRWLYQLVPPLQWIQNPGRFQAILALTALPPLASAAARRSRHRTLAERFAYLGCIGALLACLGTVAYVWQLHSKRALSPEFKQELENRGDYLRRVYLRWSDRQIAVNPWRLAGLVRQTSAAAVGEGSGTVYVEHWQSRDIRLRTSCAEPCRVTVGQFYYPRWRATSSVTGEPLEIGPTPGTGLISLRTAGPGSVRLLLPESAAEAAGRWISVCSVFILASWTAYRRAGGRLNPTRQHESRVGFVRDSA